jgi:hypothetical protein
MKNVPKKSLVNAVKKENSQRKAKKIANTFGNAVQVIDDPRNKTGAIDYPLVEILFTALVAVICGASSYPEIETFGKEQLRWLKKFFPFKNDTPSHDERSQESGVRR